MIIAKPQGKNAVGDFIDAWSRCAHNSCFFKKNLHYNGIQWYLLCQESILPSGHRRHCCFRSFTLPSGDLPGNCLNRWCCRGILDAWHQRYEPNQAHYSPQLPRPWAAALHLRGPASRDPPGLLRAPVVPLAPPRHPRRCVRALARSRSSADALSPGHNRQTPPLTRGAH